MAVPETVKCMHCGNEQAFKLLAPLTCQKCGGTWMEPVYDYAAFKREVLRGLRHRSYDIWRYHEVLPVDEPSTLDFKNVGWTPLQQARRWGALFNHPNLYVKDERYGPTSSFKDRQAVLSVASMYGAGINECVIASTGNAAVAYAAACARVGIKLWVFMTSLVPQEKLREAALGQRHIRPDQGNCRGVCPAARSTVRSGGQQHPGARVDENHCLRDR
jgi:threonine synthase